MDTQLIIRIIVSVIAAINMFAGVFGYTKLDVDENAVYTVVSTLAVIVTWIWGFWKNNNFTKAAKAGQEVIDGLKAVEKDLK